MQDVNKDTAVILEVENLRTVLSGQEIHKGLSLSIKRGEIVGFIGPSGEGKTTLLRTILMLIRPESGAVKVFGVDTKDCTEEQAKWVRQQWGVMFQSGALFGSLTVLENVMFPIKEDKVHISKRLIKELALFKIALVGLSKDDALKYPAELSGGMKKRVALARALALDPALIFLDEPTSGLDPRSADDFDKLVLRLHKDLDITVVIISHDLDTLWRVTDRVIFIGGGKILANCAMPELLTSKDSVIQEYLSGPRGRQIRTLEGKGDGY